MEPTTLDLTRPDVTYLAVTLATPGGDVRLDVTEPHKALADRLDAYARSQTNTLDDLYAVVSAVLSTNAQGVALSAAEVDEALSAAECLKVLRAYDAARAAHLAGLSKN